MQQEEFIINLDLPPRERWHFLIDFKDELNALLQCYLNDFEGAEYLFEGIRELKNAVISQDYLDEIDFIASISDFSAEYPSHEARLLGSLSPI